MSYKTADYEKKKGECPRHGEQVMWLGCTHVGKGYPTGIFLGPNRIAVCPECAERSSDEVAEELLVCCAACIKGKIKDLRKRMPDDADIQDYVKGFDVYKQELLDD
jgi:hypothetical protein